MAEIGDHCIGAEILLPNEDEMAKCHVVRQSDNTSENVMDRAHTNPILDIRMYQVCWG